MIKTYLIIFFILWLLTPFFKSDKGGFDTTFFKSDKGGFDATFFKSDKGCFDATFFKSGIK